MRKSPAARPSKADSSCASRTAPCRRWRSLDSRAGRDRRGRRRHDRIDAGAGATADAAHVERALRLGGGDWTRERAILHRRDPRRLGRRSRRGRQAAEPRRFTRSPARRTPARDHARAGSCRRRRGHRRPPARVVLLSRLDDRALVGRVDRHPGRAARALAWRLCRVLHDRRHGADRPRAGVGCARVEPASLRLGAKLGFKPIGEMVVFSRGGWVFLSGGFAGA